MSEAVAKGGSREKRGSKEKRGFIGLKDLVFCVLMGVLMLVASLVVALPFAASLPMMYFLVPAIAALIWGVLLVVVMAKCPRTGAVFVPFVVCAAYFLASGSVYVAAMIVVAGLLSECVLLGGGYASTVRGFVPVLLLSWINAMGSTLTMLLFRDSMVQAYLGMGMDAAAAEAAIAAVETFWLAPENVLLALATSAAGAVVGYLVGAKFVRRHFRPAGVM